MSIYPRRRGGESGEEDVGKKEGCDEESMAGWGGLQSKSEKIRIRGFGELLGFGGKASFLVGGGGQGFVICGRKKTFETCQGNRKGKGGDTVKSPGTNGWFLTLCTSKGVV